MEELETPSQGASPEPEQPTEAAVESAPARAGIAETPEPAEEAAVETAGAVDAPVESTEATPDPVDLAVPEPEPPSDAALEPEEVPAGIAETPVAVEAPTEVAEAPAPEPEPLSEVPPETAEAPAEPESAGPAAPEVSVDELLADTEPVPVAVEVEDLQLRAVIEAIVYVAEEPLTLAQLSASLQQPQERIRALIDQLVAEFDKPEHGVTVREVAGGYKMATKAEHHEAVRSFVKSLKPPLKLSLPALETLAVIAYKQPVTGPEIMEIRGVQGAGVLKTLLDRKLIAVAGRKNVIGKPILYKTTKEFLIQFGLKDLTELPSLKEFEEIRRMAFADSEPAAEAAAPAPESQTLEAPAAEAAPAEAQAPEAGAAAPAPAEGAPEAAPAEPIAEAPAEPAESPVAEPSAEQPGAPGADASSTEPADRSNGETGESGSETPPESASQTEQES